MNKPFISVIIVVYKSETVLSKCIRSLQKSLEWADVTYEFILVVNDKKNKKYIFPKECKKLFFDNIGLARGLNEGAKLSKGEWLLLINPDTVTSVDCVKKMVSAMHKNVGIIAPKILTAEGNLQLTINYEPSLWNIFLEQSYLYKLFPDFLPFSKANKHQYEYTHEVEAVEGTYYLVQKKAFNVVSGYDPRFFMYFEDLDLYRRIRKTGYKIIFIHNATVKHIGHQSSKGVMIADIFVQNFRKYLNKYHNKFFVLTALFFLYFGSLVRFCYWDFRLFFTHNEAIGDFMVKKRSFYKEIIRVISEHRVHRN